MQIFITFLCVAAQFGTNYGKPARSTEFAYYGPMESKYFNNIWGSFANPLKDRITAFVLESEPKDFSETEKASDSEKSDPECAKATTDDVTLMKLYEKVLEQNKLLSKVKMLLSEKQETVVSAKNGISQNDSVSLDGQTAEQSKNDKKSEVVDEKSNVVDEKSEVVDEKSGKQEKAAETQSKSDDKEEKKTKNTKSPQDTENAEKAVAVDEKSTKDEKSDGESNEKVKNATVTVDDGKNDTDASAQAPEPALIAADSEITKNVNETEVVAGEIVDSESSDDVKNDTQATTEGKKSAEKTNVVDKKPEDDKKSAEKTNVVDKKPEDDKKSAENTNVVDKKPKDDKKSAEKTNVVDKKPEDDKKSAEKTNNVDKKPEDDENKVEKSKFDDAEKDDTSNSAKTPGSERVVAGRPSPFPVRRVPKVQTNIDNIAAILGRPEEKIYLYRSQDRQIVLSDVLRVVDAEN